MATIPFVYTTSKGKTNCPMYPGAYIINSNYGSLPIYGSTANFSDAGMNDFDDLYLILPGFKLQVWQDFNWGSTLLLDYDNTNGTTIIYKTPTSINFGSSCRLFFGSKEVINVLTSTTYSVTTTTTFTSPTTSQIPPSLIINKFKDFPHFPGAYFISAGSIPIFCCIYDLRILGNADEDNMWGVMPGFILVVYYNNYSGTCCVIDNSAGSAIYFKRPVSLNQANSCKLYYNTTAYENAITIAGIS